MKRRLENIARRVCRPTAHPRNHGHDVATVHQMGWAGIKNGELLARASKAFDVFITVDGNLPYQTRAAGLRVSVLVLRGRSSRLADLLPLIPGLPAAIPSATPGSIQVIAVK